MQIELLLLGLAALGLLGAIVYKAAEIIDGLTDEKRTVRIEWLDDWMSPGSR